MEIEKLDDTLIKEKEEYRDHLASIDEEGKRKWVYAKKPSGWWHRRRLIAGWIILSFIFLLPYVQINGEPLFLLNFPEKKFILFGKIFWSQDFILFGLGMIIFVVFVSLFTIIYGRIFCGFACPQTLFMEFIFRKIEYAIEGDRNQQIKLSQLPWNNQQKLLKKILKFSVFYLISYFISYTIWSYILGFQKALKIALFQDHLGLSLGLMVFAGIVFFVFAWFREQVCLIVCPYGRLQGVLTDRNTLIIAYDKNRGEPRGKRKKNSAGQHLGDCVDCGLCVQVCPTGIDIRNGTQLECIHCAACIDECNTVMEKIGKPKGLIRFSSLENLGSKIYFNINKRVKFYSFVLLLLLAAEASLIITRSDFKITVQKAKGIPYIEKDDRRFANLYTFELLNKTNQTLDDISIKIPEIENEIQFIGKKPSLKSKSITHGEFMVIIPKNALKERKSKIKIELYHNNKKLGNAKTIFYAPIF
ncbi:MAG: cytochrome c oxidase accessory protein CcoG [Bacteroidia bacterium]|nr:cytochrome c oxidase accessory protein CcoG [Bacteroidia bacterium]